MAPKATSRGLAVLAVIGSAGLALAASDAQKCLDGRVKAYTRYQSCVQKALSRAYLNPGFDQKSFAKCRMRYAQVWPKLQSLAGMDCADERFVADGDTLKDNLSGLVWERKRNYDGLEDHNDPHDADNRYTWTDTDADTTNEDGTLFTDFLAKLNGEPGFADAYGWRIPSAEELLGILLPEPYPCTVHPCIDGLFGPTQPAAYWSVTSGASGSPSQAWDVDFDTGCMNCHNKQEQFPARAVRGGLF